MSPSKKFDTVTLTNPYPHAVDVPTLGLWGVLAGASVEVPAGDDADELAYAWGIKDRPAAAVENSEPDTGKEGK